jgi:hypothetical protein
VDTFFLKRIAVTSFLYESRFGFALSSFLIIKLNIFYLEKIAKTAPSAMSALASVAKVVFARKLDLVDIFNTK